MKKLDSLKRQAELACCAVRGFYEGLPDGYVINADLYGALTRRLAAHFHVAPYIMYQSAAFYEGRTAEMDTIYDLCYIACANRELLRSNVVPFRAMEITEPEKSIVRFLIVTYSDDREYAEVKAQCLTGRHAMCVVSSSVPLYELYNWEHVIGYNDKIEDSFSAPVPSIGLPGLYALAELSPHPDNTIQNVKIKVKADADVKKENREIIRHRVGDEWCPKKRDEFIAEEEGYCALYCPSGWDECPYSGHSLTYDIGDCPECGGTKVAMHPVYPERCVQCQRKKEGFIID